MLNAAAEVFARPNCQRGPRPRLIKGAAGRTMSAPWRELRPTATSGRGAVAAGREGGHRALWRGALL